MAALEISQKLWSHFSSSQRPHVRSSSAPGAQPISPPCLPYFSISLSFRPFYLCHTRHSRLSWKPRGRKVAFEEEEDDDRSVSSKFEDAVTLFNRGEYYACHDLLESIWYSSNDPIRTLIHGILQSAVAFHHLSNQNHKGAMLELGEGLCKLRKLDFREGPFHQFEQEISDVLEFIYQTQLELAACNDEFCISMDQSEKSYQLLGGFGAGERLYSFETDENQVSYIVFHPKSYNTPNPPSRVKLPTLQENLMVVCEQL